MIYLDSNATTQVDPKVLDAMLPFLREAFANPSASYRAARGVRSAIETARQQVAAMIGAARAEELIFTSCGTESINAAHVSVRSLWPDRPGLVHTGTEHAAGIECAKRWREAGGRVTAVPVTPQGRVDLAALEQALDAGEVALVSIMWANNETGVIAPIREIVELAHAAGALVHCDAVQAVGKIPVDVQKVPVDFLSLSGHKIHAPKGVGALYVSGRVRFRPLLVGGGQESGRRSGTENVAGIVGLGTAAALAMSERSEHALRDTFEGHVMAMLRDTIVWGDREHRLPNTSCLGFPGMDAAGLLILLDEAGVCCSAGSACHTASLHPSHVLESMGVSAADASSMLRFSFSRFNTMDEAALAADAVIHAVEKMRVLKDDASGPVAFS
ncbi:MAG: cysteine desulfurase [Verrucomicrobiales bacterium]|nr:cysteine desulfurase [Verrucomicrobiales bacterium]MCP5559280.1 cysteine desulfurase [Verrucomicrobiaceae bacterium]